MQLKGEGGAFCPVVESKGNEKQMIAAVVGNAKPPYQTC